MKKYSAIFIIFFLTLQLNAQKVVKTYWDTYTRKKIQKQYTTTNDGFLNGLYKENYYDGSPQRTVMYKFDKKDGLYKEWWPNGNLKVSGAFASDIKQGWFSWYTERGALSTQELYLDGVSREEKEMYNIPGTPINKHTWYDENHTSTAYKIFRENGKLRQEAIAPYNGIKGWCKTYFKSGKLRSYCDTNQYWDDENFVYYDLDGVTIIKEPLEDQ